MQISNSPLGAPILGSTLSQKQTQSHESSAEAVAPTGPGQSAMSQQTPSNGPAPTSEAKTSWVEQAQNGDRVRSDPNSITPTEIQMKIAQLQQATADANAIPELQSKEKPPEAEQSSAQTVPATDQTEVKTQTLIQNLATMRLADSSLALAGETAPSQPDAKSAEKPST